MNNAILGALEKLTISRERLRAALATSNTSNANRRSEAASSGLFEALETILPGGTMLWDAVGPSLKYWWEQHPLHSSSELAGDVIQAWVRPMVQRHPVAAVATALAFGATLAWARPWRWTFKHPVLSALGPSLLARGMTFELVQTWLATALAKMALAPAPGQAPPPDAAPVHPD
ncbi:MAG: hypothetical protein U5L73_10265 [Rhodoferax sp.]|uniref:hypothetical protein n=1 Tax=Rhodoferax sp. TaxID=50421 RepID=UPI002ACEB34D|nr:hypothetical protein [Rhodoferax sp.]MDZ7892125.1 hypothetical protein [Rhodoferax sp.]